LVLMQSLERMATPYQGLPSSTPDQKHTSCFREEIYTADGGDRSYMRV
jgi:hypothetical protein